MRNVHKSTTPAEELAIRCHHALQRGREFLKLSSTFLKRVGREALTWEPRIERSGALQLANDRQNPDVGGGVFPVFVEGMAEEQAQLAALANDGAEVGVIRAPRWLLLAPFGEFPHTAIDLKRPNKTITRVQRLANEDVAEMIKNFGHAMRKVLSPLGLPIYIGHPDNTQFSDRDKDKTAYGRVKKLRMTDRGLEGLVKWSDKGRAIVANEEFDGLSPNWTVMPIEGRKKHFGPVELISVGMVNGSNLRVPLTPEMANQSQQLSHDEENQDQEQTKNQIDEMDLLEQILLANGSIKPGELAGMEDDARQAALAKASQQLLAETTDLRALANAAGEYCQRIVNNSLNGENDEKKTAELANELAISEDALQQIVDGVAELQTMISVLGKEPDADADEEVDEELANERKARAELQVAELIRTGKVTPGSKDATIEALANAKDYDAEVAKLANATTTMRTVAGGGAHSDAVAGQDAKVRESAAAVIRPGEKLRMLANELVAGNGTKWADAWNQVNADPANAALVEEMNNPAE